MNGATRVLRGYSSGGLQLRVPTAMAERQGQGCHHSVPHPGLPETGTELGPSHPGLILLPSQTVQGSADVNTQGELGFLGKLVTRESGWLPASDRF